MNEDIPIRKITTSCRDCVFAAREGDTNNDCTLGRIDRFEAAGFSVAGVDDGVRRYLTVDTFCNACHDADSPYLEGVPPKDWAAHVRDLVRVRCAALVYLDVHDRREELESILGVLAAMTIKPVQVVVILDGTHMGPGLAIGLVRRTLPGVEFQVLEMRPGDDVSRQVYRSDYLRAIDHAASKLDPTRATYYLECEAGSLVPPDLLRRLDDAINREMIPVAAVLDDEFAIIQLHLHNHPQVMGNRGVPIRDKFPSIVEAYGSGFRVLRASELPA